jgi:hypothetical protein
VKRVVRTNPQHRWTPIQQKSTHPTTLSIPSATRHVIPHAHRTQDIRNHILTTSSPVTPSPRARQPPLPPHPPPHPPPLASASVSTPLSSSAVPSPTAHTTTSRLNSSSSKPVMECGVRYKGVGVCTCNVNMHFCNVYSN